ncbi:MAG: FAD-binding oxidoreductase, partial [Synechocystis sp.]
KIGVLPTQSVNFLQQAPGLAHLQLGTGLGYLQAPELAVSELRQQRTICQNYGGYLTLLDAPHALKSTEDVWGYQGNGLELMTRLKQQFDPQGLFSPGRFVGEL